MPEPIVIFEDNHCIAVVKPWNMLVQGDITGDAALIDWVKDWVKQKYAKPGNVFIGLLHRIDRPAGGIVLFARTSKAASRLSEQFRTGTIAKRYLAVLHGEPPPEDELVDYLLKDHERNTAINVSSHVSGSKEARLRYRVVAAGGGGLSLVEVDLITGRPHQIRVQMSSRGWPLCGDLKYGAPKALAGRNIALFSAMLEFDHPVTKERIRLLAEPPGDEYPWKLLQQRA
ncbi:MAG: RluA family pseudouridine synthase [Nitrospirae bacterium]|nr:RluA family pseudouridine synthase [Nitrospirota bacterium]